MVARCPFAEARFLPESSTQPRIKPTQIISHTMAGTLSGTDAWFRRGDVKVETHFGIGRGGRLYQWMDTTVRADGNYKANRRPDGTGAVSIETEGYASESWTQAQIDMLVRLHVWLMRTHTSIGRRICRTADDPGLGYHTMFGAPGPWTPVAKDCPGRKRIQQWREVVVPRVLAALEEEDDMPLNDDDLTKVRSIMRDEVRGLLNTLLGRSGPTVGVALQSTYQLVKQIAARVDLDEDEIARIVEACQREASGGQSGEPGA